MNWLPLKINSICQEIRVFLPKNRVKTGGVKIYKINHFFVWYCQKIVKISNLGNNFVKNVLK